MGVREARSPDGVEWTVKRRWIPRLRGETVWYRFHTRFRQTFRRMGDLSDADPGCLEVFGEGLAAGLLIILTILLLVFVVIPLLVAVVDVLIVLILAVGALAGRVLFRRPWVVEACSSLGQRRAWFVVGWRASGEWRDAVARQLAAGVMPPEGPVLPGATG